MTNTSINLVHKQRLRDEDDYIEIVDYHMTILSLLTNEEESVILKRWKQVVATEGLFEKVFKQMFNENSLLKNSFDGLEHINGDELINHHQLKQHNAEVLSLLNTVFENIKNPNLWIKDMFRTSCMHELYKVESEHLHAFKRITKAYLMEGADVQEDLKVSYEEIWDKVLNCIIGILHQFMDV